MYAHIYVYVHVPSNDLFVRLRTYSRRNLSVFGSVLRLGGRKASTKSPAGLCLSTGCALNSFAMHGLVDLFFLVSAASAVNDKHIFVCRSYMCVMNLEFFEP